jgi:hypothetical protein
LSDLDFAIMAVPQPETSLDRATFRRSPLFGGIDLMSARFARHSFAPHSHDELMIGVIQAGVKSFRCGRSRDHAATGSLSVANPGEMHTGECKDGPELVYAAVYLQEAVLATMLEWPRPGSALVGQPVINDQEVWRWLADAHALAMAGDDGAAAEEAMVCGVALLFERYGTSRTARSAAGCSKTVDRAVSFMQARACDRISLEDASRASFISSGCFRSTLA